MAHYKHIVAMRNGLRRIEVAEIHQGALPEVGSTTIISIEAKPIGIRVTGVRSFLPKMSGTAVEAVAHVDAEEIELPITC